MVEATQTTYTGPTTYDTTQTSGIKGKLAQLKGKLSGQPTALNEPYMTGVPPATTYTQQPIIGGVTQQPILGTTAAQQPLLTQPTTLPTTTAPYPASTTAPLGTSTLPTTSTTGFGTTGLGTTGLSTTGVGTSGLGTTGLGTTGLGTAGLGTTGLGTTGLGTTGLGTSQTFVPSAAPTMLPATSGLTSGFSSQRSSISVAEQPVLIGGGAPIAATATGAIQATEVIQERPVLDRVEKIIQKEVVQKPRIQEQFRQDIIEVHEKPIEKRFMHPMQEFRVQEQTQFEIQGKEAAEFERTNLINQLRERDRLHQVTVDQRQDVKMFQDAPLMTQSKEMRKEVIYKPIVTEIHEQPIREIHEQSIQRTIYEKPIVTVIRDQSVIENITSTQPLTGISYQATPLMTRQQQVIAQPILTQTVLPTAQNVVIEKGAAENLPHVVGTNLNPSEVDRMENQTFIRK